MSHSLFFGRIFPREKIRRGQARNKRRDAPSLGRMGFSPLFFGAKRETALQVVDYSATRIASHGILNEKTEPAIEVGGFAKTCLVPSYICALRAKGPRSVIAANIASAGTRFLTGDSAEES